MVEASSSNSSTKVSVSSGSDSNAVTASNSMAQYYSELAKEWAISESIVENEDYSSKYYASVAQDNADAAKDYLAQVKETAEEALSDIADTKTTIGSLTNVSELTNDAGYLTADDTIIVQEITQEDYLELKKKDDNTLYIVCTQLLIWGTSSWGIGVWGLQDDNE